MAKEKIAPVRLNKNTMTRKYMLIGLCFMLPAFATYIIFMGYPLARTFQVSLMRWDGFNPMSFIGLENYRNIIGDTTFWLALRNTLYFSVVAGIISVFLGLILAWFNMHLFRMEGQVFRTVKFSPSMIAPTITGLLFIFVFSESIGLLNNLLIVMGLENLTTAWLGNLATVRPAVVVAQVWRQFGFAMVVCYAGLQGVPKELIESSRLDGASDWQIFTRILIPMIKPQLEISMMFAMLWGLRIYDSVVSLTGGGPVRQTIVVPMWIIDNAFGFSRHGYAAALSVVFILVTFIFILIMRLAFRGGRHEY